MRKLLNSLYIIDETAWLTLDGENLVCKCHDNEKFRMPFSNIEDIYCFSYLGCSNTTPTPRDSCAGGMPA